MSDATIKGRVPVIFEAIAGGYCIAAKGIRAAHLYKDGEWHLANSTDETSADEWTWPSHTAARIFIRTHADQGQPFLMQSEIKISFPVTWDIRMYFSLTKRITRQQFARIKELINLAEDSCVIGDELNS